MDVLKRSFMHNTDTSGNMMTYPAGTPASEMSAEAAQLAKSQGYFDGPNQPTANPDIVGGYVIEESPSNPDYRLPDSIRPPDAETTAGHPDTLAHAPGEEIVAGEPPKTPEELKADEEEKTKLRESGELKTPAEQSERDARQPENQAYRARERDEDKNNRDRDRRAKEKEAARRKKK